LKINVYFFSNTSTIILITHHPRKHHATLNPQRSVFKRIACCRNETLLHERLRTTVAM
jgi:hypothetical protein